MYNLIFFLSQSLVKSQVDETFLQVQNSTCQFQVFFYSFTNPSLQALTFCKKTTFVCVSHAQIGLGLISACHIIVFSTAWHFFTVFSVHKTILRHLLHMPVVNLTHLCNFVIPSWRCKSIKQSLFQIRSAFLSSLLWDKTAVREMHFYSESLQTTAAPTTSANKIDDSLPPCILGWRETLTQSLPSTPKTAAAPIVTLSCH